MDPTLSLSNWYFNPDYPENESFKNSSLASSDENFEKLEKSPLLFADDSSQSEIEIIAGGVLVVYIGSVNEEGKPHGFGSCCYPEDAPVLYRGQWKNGAMDGKGTVYYKNGNRRYEGNFQNGKPLTVLEEGADIVYNEDGKVMFFGAISEKGGEGTCFINGYKYEGTVNEEYKPHGKCDVYDSKGRHLYSGPVAEGKFEGIGIFKEENGDRYFGSFRNNEKHGQGILYDTNNKTKYIGVFCQNKIGDSASYHENQIKDILKNNNDCQIFDQQGSAPKRKIRGVNTSSPLEKRFKKMEQPYISFEGAVQRLNRAKGWQSYANSSSSIEPQRQESFSSFF